MTQLEIARKGKISSIMSRVAKIEKTDPEILRKKIAEGRVILLSNTNKNIEKPCAIGEGLRTKVNANIGTSTDVVDIKYEAKKLKICISAGADAVMDLSTGGDLTKIRKDILRNCKVPLGTVPMYEAAVIAASRRGGLKTMTEDDLFNAIEKQAQEGVDFQTVHCGITLESVERIKKQGRILDVVSRGGALLIEWMIYNKRENPLYEKFDKIIDIARKHDIVLSLGDGLRPGCVADASDRGQFQELIILGELCKKAQSAGVQVMVEGPGHMPIDQIVPNVILQKKLCQGAPFYVLGPLVTDIAPGYDHITSAIGGAVAASAGADFLCYVTPSEHLRLPSLEDVQEGIIAARIAAHCADIAKNIPGAIEWDKKISIARKKRDWKKQMELAIDPVKPFKLRKSSRPIFSDVCTMCGKYCAIKLVEEYFK